jgi:hypothetical protein
MRGRATEGYGRPVSANLKRSGRPPLCIGLPLQLRPTRSKPQPFLVVRTERFFGHAEANVGLLAIVCRQNPEADWPNGCHQAPVHQCPTVRRLS